MCAVVKIVKYLSDLQESLSLLSMYGSCSVEMGMGGASKGDVGTKAYNSRTAIMFSSRVT